MRPVDKFKKIMGVVRTATSMLGSDMADPNYKVNWITWTAFILICMFHVFSFMTIVKRFSENWTIVLQVFSTLSASTQGLAKLLTAMLYSDRFYKLYVQLNGIYEKYQEINKRYAEKLHNRCDQLKKIVIAVGFVYMISGILMIMVPFVLLFYNGERHMLLLVEIPMLDANTESGYFIVSAFHAISVAMACFGLYGGDLYVLIYLTHSLIFYDIFVLKVEDLHTMLDECAEEDSVTATVTDIVEWHQIYLSFNGTCNFLFYWVISAQVICSTVAMISTLFIILTGGWVGAYSYLLNDNLCEEIYNIRWYELSLKQQKMVSVMLLKSQSPPNICIVEVLPMTVSTALMISRTIYTMFTMFLQFLE